MVTFFLERESYRTYKYVAQAKCRVWVLNLTVFIITNRPGAQTQICNLYTKEDISIKIKNDKIKIRYYYWIEILAVFYLFVVLCYAYT